MGIARIVGCLIVAGLPALAAAEPLPGTQPLTLEGDLAEQMVSGIDKFLLRELDRSVERRARHWKRDFSSAKNYEQSLAPQRVRLATILGAADERPKHVTLELVASIEEPALVGRGAGFEVFAVRWPAVRGVSGEGLLLRPKGKPVANLVALPDADHSPEMLAGLVAGVASEQQFARRLAESGCQVLVPLLMNRDDAYSATEKGVHKTNQPHREFVYRPAFEMGRHVIGYEVQKVLAAIDWMQRADEATPVGVIGHGEGGLLALYSAALDPRIDAAAVCGYFDSRQNVWQEPIYRNVFALLDEFGDAELASMIAPRALVVEACRAPEIEGPPPMRADRRGAAPGRIVTPALAAVKAELDRARGLVGKLQPAPRLELVESEGGKGPCGTKACLDALLSALGAKAALAPLGEAPAHLRKQFGPNDRLRAQFDEMVADTQELMRESEYVRAEFWSRADRQSRSPEAWKTSAAPYREHFYNEVIGRFDQPLAKPNARSRKIYDEPKYTGYEVVLDVFPDVIAQGILLLPKGIGVGERRPVVVCQHGLEGRPTDVADPKLDHPAYHRFACRLADEGFIVYAPQNPYLFKDKFRTLQRKANPLKKTLFSIIVPQHEQTVRWLGSLPQADASRIGFYGLSYGGKTAMRVPALVDGYALSICSADFNEWIWKNASTRASFSYVHTGEYEIFEFNLGNTYNYAEMAALIAPRPFMVERGHRDLVGPDSWVAYEFAKVRLLYTDLKIADRTQIEFFDGPHTINGQGTFEFLRRHLKWPQAKTAAAANPRRAVAEK